MRVTLKIALAPIAVLSIWIAGPIAVPGQSPKSVPQPPAEIQSLAKALVGKWSTTYDFEAGGMSPTAATGTGEEVWRTGPGGFVLMEEERIHASFGESYVFALHWWDKSTSSLRGMLCNNSGPAACNVDSYSNSTLKWNGKQLTIDLQFPQKDKKMLWHEVWSGITSTSFTQTGDMGEVGGPLKRVVTIHGTKAAEADRPSM
jgi:hypothetical protein